MEAGNGPSPTQIKVLEDKVDEWALSEDVALLDSLKSISKSFLDGSESVKKSLSKLDNDFTKCSLRVSAANNNLTALASKQFVENRVYDDEIPKPSGSKQEETKSPSTLSPEELLLSNVKVGIHTGIGLLSTHFQRIHIDPKQFDEDEQHFLPPPIYEPMEVFASPSLPYIIGSAAFNQSAMGGVLADEGIEESKEEDDTLIISTAKKSDQNLTVDTRKPIFGEQPPSDSSGMNRSDSSNSLFRDDAENTNSSGSRESPNFLEPPKPIEQKKLNGPHNFGNKPTAAPRVLPGSNEQDSSSGDESDDFGKPPPLPKSEPKPKEQSPVFPQKSFQKPILPKELPSSNAQSLFESDDDEQDIFTTLKSKDSFVKQEQSKSTKTGGNKVPTVAKSTLFLENSDDDDSDIFQKEPPPLKRETKIKPVEKVVQKPVQKTQKKQTIFDDDDNDIFAPPPLDSERLGKDKIEQSLNKNSETEDGDMFDAGGDSPLPVKKVDPLMDELKNKLNAKAPVAKDKPVKGLKNESTNDILIDETDAKLISNTDNSMNEKNLHAESNEIIDKALPTLEHLAKTRARIPASKRRPPTRKQLVNDVGSANPQAASVPEKITDLVPGFEGPPPLPVGGFTDKREEKADQFDEMEPPPLPEVAGAVKRKQDVGDTKFVPPLMDNGEDRKEISTGATDLVTKEIVSKVETEVEVKKPNPVIEASKVQKNDGKSAKSEVVQKKKVVEKQAEPVKKAATLFDSGSDDEDIFSVPTKKTVAPVVPQVNKETPAKNSNESKVASKPVSTKSVPKSSLFDDSSDDDLFK